ncbi:Mannosylfructose-phosphate synthase [Maioricimonas rarisocia]|uniref:Mannosylfructose-phosphate synthase n=1 Tax=Maioricimonas rarisocia TaxID=2528026 RepID=A0A517ZD82_9PLAN|nr:glycosyltransferase family 4 protein [Maioricimonas rarisocia]QDU40419.1 Mannosylfructose-phosphate synthase [Maioricimonas rarisocia]
MRIALVAHRFGGPTGGIERAVEELARRLCSDHEVHVFTQQFDAPEIADSVVHHPIPQLTRRWSLNLLWFFLLSRYYVSREQFDVIHLHCPAWIPEAISTCHGHPRAGIEAYRKIAGQYSRKEFRRRARRFRLCQPILEYNYKPRNCQAVIAVSPEVHRGLVSLCGTPEAKLHVIPNGVDASAFAAASGAQDREAIRREYGIEQEAFVFLFVGNFFHRKGLNMLIQAFAKLDDASCRLMVVGGDEKSVTWASELSAEYGAGDRVVFCGMQRDVPRYYAASDAFVFPSIYEPFGLVVLEAMASGLPVVSGRTGVSEEVVETGVNGLLVDNVADCGELARAMAVLSQAPADAKEMGRQARESAKRFSWDASVASTVELYEQVVGLRGK